MSTKIQMINEFEGLSALIHGGSDRVVVLQTLEGDYAFDFYKANEDMPAYAHETVPAALVETKMREYCSDLRNWRKFAIDTE